MSIDSIHQIKIWILDHACKHGMDSVIKLIVNDTSVEELFGSVGFISEELGVNPTFSLMLLLKNLIESLKAARRDVTNKYATWNKSLLTLVTKLLTSAYTQDQYIPVKSFLNLIMRLKRMEMTDCLLGQPTVVVQKLNNLFPQMSRQYKTELQQQYGLNESVLTNLQNSHTTFRRFILQLMNNSNLKHEYISRCFANDMKKYISYVLGSLINILTILTDKAGPSVIEKIVMEGSNNQHYSNNPAILLVLEYIQEEIAESNLISLLHSFDSHVQLAADDGFIETGSELGSQQGLCSTEIYSSSDEEECISTVKKKRTLIGNTNSFDPLAAMSGCFVPMDDENEIFVSEDEMS